MDTNQALAEIKIVTALAQLLRAYPLAFAKALIAGGTVDLRPEDDGDEFIAFYVAGHRVGRAPLAWLLDDSDLTTALDFIEIPSDASALDSNEND